MRCPRGGATATAEEKLLKLYTRKTQKLHRTEQIA